MKPEISACNRWASSNFVLVLLIVIVLEYVFKPLNFFVSLWFY